MNKPKEQPEEEPGSEPATSADTGNGIMNNEIRLSRLNHPRGTLVAMAMLAAVFLLFGVFANAMHPELAAGTDFDERCAVIFALPHILSSSSRTISR